MVIVKLKSEESRRKILENKRKLRGKEIWIEEDQTFKERKMKWKLRQIAGEEERRGERGRRRREILEEKGGKGERAFRSREGRRRSISE